MITKKEIKDLILKKLVKIRVAQDIPELAELEQDIEDLIKEYESSPSPNLKTEPWEIEFSERFKDLSHVGCDNSLPCATVKSDVKKFITQLLSKAKLELAKDQEDGKIPYFNATYVKRLDIIELCERERLVKKDNGDWVSDKRVVSSELHRYATGFNEAINDIITTLKDKITGGV